MTNSHADETRKRWSRPPPPLRDHPLRTVGGLYRTPDDGQGGLAGVPLSAAEDAVVAAVRMAYKVAQAQVDRSTRLAKRLRVAGDRVVGARSDRKAVDATEELISRAMTGALTWFEGLAAEGDSPLKRLALAQYRLIGATLGLAPHPEGARPSAASAPEATPSGLDTMDASAASKSYASLQGVKVILKGKGRPVRVCHLDVAGAPPFAATPIHFYNATHFESDPLEAEFAMDVEGRATLTLSPQRPAPPGRWRAAICHAATEEQIGVIEIEL
jgi:hypothetical protein